jgi:hypothetical protein
VQSFLVQYYPPGLDPAGEPGEGETVAGIRLRSHPLTAPDISSIAASLRARAVSLRLLPVRDVLSALADVHGAWAAPDSLLRQEAAALLHLRTGYPPSVLDGCLRSLFAGMHAREMQRWLVAGGVNPICMLDGAVGRQGAALAFGPDLAAVVASGNIPGAAVPTVAQALLLKSACFVKSSSQEPVLLPLYARSIAEREPRLANALAVTSWESGRTELEDALLAGVDALIVYGSDAALIRLRSCLPPHARFVGYGHRISFSAVGRELLTAEAASDAAARAAHDCCLFDQQGCLSPQALYVEQGGEIDPPGFAALVAEALEAAERRLPRRSLNAGEAAAIHQYRASVEMRALTDPDVRLWNSSDGTRWSVALDPDPALAPCCLNRTVVARPIGRLEDLPDCIAPYGSALMSAGLGVGEERREAIARALGAVGVTRITALGKAQEPRGALFHDGMNAIGCLARFVRVER